MPKIKTRKAVSKRLRVTGSGKVQRMQQNSGCKHIREKKSPKRTRGFRKIVLVHETDAKRLRLLAPYLF